jgi:hypothetical protein
VIRGLALLDAVAGKDGQHCGPAATLSGVQRNAGRPGTATIWCQAPGSMSAMTSTSALGAGPDHCVLEIVRLPARGLPRSGQGPLGAPGGVLQCGARLPVGVVPAPPRAGAAARLVIKHGSWAGRIGCLAVQAGRIWRWVPRWLARYFRPVDPGLHWHQSTELLGCIIGIGPAHDGWGGRGGRWPPNQRRRGVPLQNAVMVSDLGFIESFTRPGGTR